MTSCYLRAAKALERDVLSLPRALSSFRGYSNMTTRRPPRPDCRYQEWLARVTRWGYRSVNRPTLLMEHGRQQVIVGDKPIRTRLVHKNAEPMPRPLIRKNAGDTPPRRLEDPEGPNTVVQKKTSLHTRLRVTPLKWIFPVPPLPAPLLLRTQDVLVSH